MKRRSRSSMRRMRYLVVFAHPDPESFSAALCAQAVSALRSAGHHVDLIDLYADEFSPAMNSDERHAYESVTPIISAQIDQYAALVRQAEGIVFVYPTWWWGMPAIMKGFLDRVLVPGVSFVFDPTSNKIRPGLTDLRRVVGISTYGSSHGAMRFFNDGGRRNISRCLRLQAPRFRCRVTWLAQYGLDASSAGDRQVFLDRVATTLAGL